MNAEATSKQAEEKPRRVRFPRKMVWLTIIVIALIVLSRVFVSELTDLAGVSPDVARVSSYLMMFLLWLSWLLWILFFSGRNWFVRFLVAAVFVGLPYGFFKILRPVNDGDVGINRLEPIWKSERELGTDVEETAFAVDLETETPEDFPQFLGKNGNGDTSNQGHLSDDALRNAKIIWKQPVGEGWSGFAARNGYAVTLEQRGPYECITCYDVDSGNLQWLTKYEARHQDAVNLGHAGPRSTPTIHNGYVYAMGAMGNLVCLHGRNGKEIWRHDIADMLGIEIVKGEDDKGNTIQYENSPLAWGRSGSPLIVDDLVVVTGGGPRGGDFVTLLAFDVETGELRWRVGQDMIAYGSPTLATLGGRRQIVLVAESKVLGFDAGTGEQLWSFPWPGSSEAAANCSQATILSDTRILLSKGYNAGGEIVDIVTDGDAFEATSVTSDPRVLKTKLTSPVIKDGYAYSLSDGFLECTDVAELTRKWKKRGRFGHGQLLLCGDKLFVHSETGTLYLVRATPDGYEELGSLDTIEGVCWNTICRYGNLVLVRSDLEAACIRLGD